MRFRVLVLFLICAPLRTVSIAVADLVTLNPVRDNTLYQNVTGSTSNGAGTAMFAGRNSEASNNLRRAVTMFDIAGGIPADSTINSVTLALHNSANNATPEPVELHRLLADWGEGASVAPGGQGGGGPAQAGDATWLHRFFPNQTWTTPGGDFSASASASQVVAGPGFYTWASTPRLVADVQAFLDDPAGNFGWVLIGNESVSNSAKRFATREEASAALRPVLTIDYTPIPEPGTAMLLGLGVWGGSMASPGRRPARLRASADPKQRETGVPHA